MHGHDGPLCVGLGKRTTPDAMATCILFSCRIGVVIMATLSKVGRVGVGDPEFGSPGSEGDTRAAHNNNDGTPKRTYTEVMAK